MVTYAMGTAPGGLVRAIVDSRQFPTYEAALDFLAGAGRDSAHVLVGRDPLRSSVPLPALPRFRDVYHSQDAGAGAFPTVRIFECRR